MMDSNNSNALATIDLGDAPVVAQASGARRGKTNWTVLTIYGPTILSGPRGPFIAEIVGETTQKLQFRRCRRAVFPTVSLALAWNAFDFQSGLYEELRTEAIAWLEKQPGPDMGLGSREESFRAAVQRSGFVAPAKQPLLAALQWLYWHGLHTPTAGELSFSFAKDFGCVAQDVFDALNREEDEGEIDWRWTVFIASLAFFDREAFQANRSSDHG